MAVKSILHEAFLLLDKIGDVNFVPTTTRIRRDAAKENKRQDPKPRMQTNLFTLVLLILLVLLFRYVYVLSRYLCLSFST